ncbi:MAG: hypothetical protein RLZZ127_1953 [Planctomycetota bacterium]|jgi:DNA-binding NtrC family response regulator
MPKRPSRPSAIAEIQRRVDRSEAAAIASRHLLDRAGELPATPAERLVVHASRTMADILAWVRLAANTARTVVISGETGTGKSLLAEALHAEAGYGALMVVDCRQQPLALPEPDAVGTLVLDALDRADASAQARILEFLAQAGRCARHPRVVGLSACPIAELVQRAAFRSDLANRLHGHHLAVPPLRERPQDIAALAAAFLTRIADERGIRRPHLDAETLDRLRQRPWPGNVRELEAEVAAMAAGRPEEPGVVFGPRLPTIRACVDQLIDEALRRTGGRQGAAARLLGITPQSLSERLQRRRERSADAVDPA